LSNPPCCWKRNRRLVSRVS